MNGKAKLSYGQIQSIADRLNDASNKMETLLEEIKALFAKIMKDGVHRWIEINLQNGNIILADATDAIDNSIDLAASKAGYSTSGFLILDESFSGIKPKELYELQNDKVNGEFYKNIIESNKAWLQVIDVPLGYATKDGYLFDQITKTKKLFSNSKVLNELFGTNSFSKKMKRMFEIDIPENMDGYECWAYLRKISSNILGDDANKISNRFLYNQTPTKIESINVVSYMDESNIIHYQIYSESSGKIYLTGQDAYNEFLKSLNLVER